ncbi:MAG: hypothetical protein A2Y62_17030 [Candidatus Fischerbacteria bacterium RBG_13_37_8]|uniref:dolichyl-phosphate-mannose--protein mannosyltransferase n=1 Tax=Candidatus Fischerbacteria bacterium RBG_13_37_8 TaxID=1817863 RepID=A0A1F5VG13_9BACT|nr:MAG: hypothetical protein A2Y62_17030 [Candidatus Fischerbacteria bacterium RBG_13_37_8]
MNNENNIEIIEKKIIFETLTANDLAKYTLVLFVLCFASYFIILSNDFTYDDHFFIQNNPYIKSVEGVYHSAFAPIKDNQAQPAPMEGNRGFNYRPVSMLLLYTIGKIFSIKPLYYHLFNILFHALNCLLIFLLALQLKLSRIVALITAVIFAVHPIHTDAVASAVGIQEEFVFFFGILGLIVLISELQYKYFIAPVLFFAALLSKENAPVLIALYIGVIVYLHITGKSSEQKSIVSVTGIMIAPMMIYFAIRYVVLKSFFRHPVLQNLILDNPLYQAGFSERILTSIYLIWKYLLLFIIPVNLSADYSFNSIPLIKSILDVRLIAAFIFLVLIIALFIYLLKWKRYMEALGMYIFFVSILPVSNLFFRSSFLFAERNSYLASLGLCLIAGSIIGYFIQQEKKNSKFAAYAFLVIVIIVMTGLTIARNKVWKNDYSLFSSVISVVPDNAKAQYNLGALHFTEGNFKKSLENFRKTSEIYPEFYSAHLGVIHSYYNLNDLSSAITYAEHAVKLFPKDENLYDFLAKLHKESGNIEQTKKVYQQGIETIENSFMLEHNLGVNYFNEGNYKEAQKYFMNALKLRESGSAHYYLGKCYMKQYKDKEALDEFIKALPVSSEFPDMLKYLSILNFNFGRYGDSAEFVLQYLKAAPEDAEGYAIGAKLSWKVDQDYQAARQLMEHALKYNPTICKTPEYIAVCVALGLPAS